MSNEKINDSELKQVSGGLLRGNKSNKTAKAITPQGFKGIVKDTRARRDGNTRVRLDKAGSGQGKKGL